MPKSNTIHINGKRYDASSGAPLDEVPPEHTGPVRVTVHHAKPAQPQQPQRSAAAVGAHRQVAKQQRPHAPAASRTLMRQAVHKPGASLKRHARIQTPADAPAPQVPPEVPGSVQAVDRQRLQHAQQVGKSHLIQHFAPAGQPEPYTPPAPAARPRPAVTVNGAPSARLAAEQAAQGQTKHLTTDELLERALRQATSHEQPPPGKIRHSRAKRNVSIAGVVGLAVVLLGVIISQNLTSVRLQAASAKAGFSASLPGYQPAGYDLGQLNYSSGVVAAHFRSNSNAGGYTVTQKRSSWNDQTLLSSFVMPTDPSYEAVQAGGRTIYLYGDGDATWVSGGFWYVIQSNGTLNNRQLVDLATSL